MPSSLDPLQDHFRNPRNVGVLEPGPSTGGPVVVENPICGDRLTLSWRLEPDGEPTAARVVETRFRALGCPASIAAGSALTVLAAGKSLAELRAFDAARISAALGGLDGRNQHAAILAVDAVRAMLASIDDAGGGSGSQV